MILNQVLLLYCLAVLTYIVIKLYKVLTDQKLWLIIAVTIQFVFMAGIFHSMLKSGKPLFKIEKTAGGYYYISEFFYKDRKVQYWCEGFIATSLYILISIGFSLLNNLSLFFDRNSDPWKIRIFVIVIMAIIYMLF